MNESFAHDCNLPNWPKPAHILDSVLWKKAHHKTLIEGLWPSFKLINFIRKHERKKLDNPLLSMKPYHFHQLLEDIQIYVCTNGPGLFEMKNDKICLSTEKIIYKIFISSTTKWLRDGSKFSSNFPRHNNVNLWVL